MLDYKYILYLSNKEFAYDNENTRNYVKYRFTNMAYCYKVLITQKYILLTDQAANMNTEDRVIHLLGTINYKLNITVVWVYSNLYHLFLYIFLSFISL